MPLPTPSPESTALVTGASAGIGTELARGLARRGHGVTLVARRADRLTRLAAELTQQHGVRADVIAADLSDTDARARLANELLEQGRRVAILVNNAGFGTAGRFVRLDPARELELVRLNCEAVLDLCHRYAPAMVQDGHGGILNVASTVAFQPLPGQATYGASKAFVLAFTEALHQELAVKGVHVTALCPGPVTTEFPAVAGLGRIEDETPAFLWSDAGDVAEAAIHGLESGQRVVVPGALNAVGATLGRLAPRRLLLSAVDRFYPVGRE